MPDREYLPHSKTWMGPYHDGLGIYEDPDAKEPVAAFKNFEVAVEHFATLRARFICLEAENRKPSEMQARIAELEERLTSGIFSTPRKRQNGRPR